MTLYRKLSGLFPPKVLPIIHRLNAKNLSAKDKESNGLRFLLLAFIAIQKKKAQCFPKIYSDVLVRHQSMCNHEYRCKCSIIYVKD